MLFLAHAGPGQEAQSSRASTETNQTSVGGQSRPINLWPPLSEVAKIAMMKSRDGTKREKKKKEHEGWENGSGLIKCDNDVEAFETLSN